MKRLIGLLLMVIGIQISAFSQTFYPKKILWGNDTVLAITRGQLVSINRTLNNYKHLKRINQKLQDEIGVLDSTVVSLQKINTLEHKSLILTEKKFQEQVSLSKELTECLAIEKKKKLKTSICVGAGGTLLGAIIGVLLIK